MEENIPDEPKRITIEQLRSFEGLKKLSDEKAIEVIESLEQLADILIEHFKLNNREDE